MILAGHQPHYLPNLAYFAKMARVDLFVITTNLRFEKRERWQQRNRIKTANGDCWLTVPVIGSENQQIKDLLISNAYDWRKSHMQTLKNAYAKSEGKIYLPQIIAIYEKSWERLVDLNVALTLAVKESLGLKTNVIVDEDISGVKHEIYINVCKKYGADSMLSGVGAKLYLTEKQLEELENHHITHEFIAKDLTAYQYATVHYLLTYGRDWVLKKIL